MSGRIVTFASSPHQRALELMPWYAAGSLEVDEQSAVEQHLPACPTCRRELQWQRELQSAYERTDVQPDVEQALARLRPQLETPAPRAAAAADWWGGVRAVLGGAAWGWTRYALAAQLGVIVALGWALAAGHDRMPVYRLLGSGAETGAATIVVVFEPEARERDIQRILRSAGARIVDGPTAGNGYLLRIVPARRDAALATLREARTVVLAEPLEADETR